MRGGDAENSIHIAGQHASVYDIRVISYVI